MQDSGLSEADIDTMMQRALVYQADVPPLTPETARQYVAYYTDDVPRLVNELRRLRAQLSQRPK
ncbi:MAG TPA: hypothetical protein VII06_36605 [Chloroflexota bacterium]|jgi:hypothetical protein